MHGLVLSLLAVAAGGLIGCSAAGPSPPAGPVPSAAAPEAGQVEPVPPATWPVAASCAAVLEALALLPADEHRRLDPATAPVALAVTAQGTAMPAGLAAPAVRRDLPLPIVERLDGSGPRCLILIEAAQGRPAAARRPIAHETVRSEYRRGTRRSASGRIRYAAPERDRDEGREILRTGDPGLDLIGAVAGITLDGLDALWRARQEAMAASEESASEDQEEATDWEPYTYQVTTVEAARVGQIRAALVDRALDRHWPIANAVRETRRFRIAAGRHAKDRALLEGGGGDGVAEAAVTVWEQGPLQPALSELAMQLARASGTSPGVPGGAAALAAMWAAPAAATAPAAGGKGKATAAAVSIRTAEGTAAAEMLAPDRIAAPLAALGRSDVVEVVAADGTRRFGLVETRDPARAWAIVRLNQPLP